MHLLLANDDGIDADGLLALEAALRPLGRVTVVAPDSERSAQSHALTMHKPLRAREVGPGRWSVSGTPADCVYLALHHLLDAPPDLVVSGINRGSNLGNDVFYSGTVAAAMEACLQGVPAVAVSLHVDPAASQRHWDTAGDVARRVVQRALTEGLGPRRLLNVNVPDVPLAALRGLRATTLGVRRYAPFVDERVDPRGRRYFWIGGDHMDFEEDPRADGPAVEAGYASITPLRPDWTDGDFVARVAAWAEEGGR